VLHIKAFEGEEKKKKKGKKHFETGARDLLNWKARREQKKNHSFLVYLIKIFSPKFSWLIRVP